MSGVPPTTPPGGAPPPYPPYDPKTQWRVYREQQRAAQRAQRDAWKAQRYAWKAGAAGFYAPCVPSVVGPILLIGVGVVALLLLTGHIPASAFWNWYGHWWPLLLIGAGLALLGEWALDMRRRVPVRRGGSFVGVILLLVLLGVGAAGWKHAQPWFSQQGVQFGLDNDFFNAFGLPEHDFDQPALSAPVSPNAAIEIDNPRGDVSVTAGDGSTISVQPHEVAYASSDADAKKIFDAEAAHLTVSGSAVQLTTEGSSRGRLNLTVTVPKTAKVKVNSGWGDVTAAGLEAGVDISSRGDIHVSSISGLVQVHFINGRHDTFTARDVQGDITLEGDVNDLSLSGIKGKVTQSGDIDGDVHMENIGGPIQLHTSVTDLAVAKLPGDLTLDSDDLRVNQAEGQVRVVTHSKDIDLNQIYGDTYAEDRDGAISIEPAGAYGVDARNGKGDVEVTLPPDASATVAVRTHNGDIVSDYVLPSTEGEDKSATFRIGSGAARIVLSADNGDVHIKKGPAFPPAPNAGAATPVPTLNARHLRTHKPLPAQPVTQ